MDAAVHPCSQLHPPPQIQSAEQPERHHATAGTDALVLQLGDFLPAWGLHVSWDHGGGIRADSQGGGGHGVSIQSLSACTLPASWCTESDRMKP